MDNQPTDCFFASGQVGGGCQVVLPFQDAATFNPYFLLPPLNHGEAMNFMCVADEKLAIGTSEGKFYNIILLDIDQKARNFFRFGIYCIFFRHHPCR
jgi:hypothetical protein